ncbi:hypothetical protein, partial [Streptomyces malaysiensis]|uniref:hypothetical protein n=1 Tax=Streptomyces malaysiensis TaxID=92644 RepID=UPI003409566F
RNRFTGLSGRFPSVFPTLPDPISGPFPIRIPFPVAVGGALPFGFTDFIRISLSRFPPPPVGSSGDR